MAGKTAPINPAVLEWALVDSGLSERELAARADLDAARLALIRSGESLPNTGEWRAIAKAVGRTPAFFFLPEPPSRPPLAASFRSPAGRRRDEPLQPDEQAALRGAARWQKIVGWVREETGEGLATLPVLVGTDSPLAAATALQTWLDWDLKEQRKSGSAAALLRLLRERLEGHGLLVLQSSLGRDACRGFSLPHPTAPVVAVNSSYNAAARVFTLLHEVVHLGRGDRAVCGDPRDDDLERWCERAAAALLIPADDLREYLDRRITEGRVDDVDQVRKVANRYHVSLRAAAVRLSEVNRATPTLYNKVERIAEVGGGAPNPNVEPQTTPVRRVRELGAAVPRALLRARETGRLSDTEVRRYLDVSGSQLADLARRLSDSAAEV